MVYRQIFAGTNQDNMQDAAAKGRTCNGDAWHQVDRWTGK